MRTTFYLFFLAELFRGFAEDAFVLVLAFRHGSKSRRGIFTSRGVRITPGNIGVPFAVFPLSQVVIVLFDTCAYEAASSIDRRSSGFSITGDGFFACIDSVDVPTAGLLIDDIPS